MKVSELRIGNQIYVKCIARECGVDDFDAQECNIFNLKSILSGNKDFLFKPIPLTEEWLLKFGFVELKKYSIAKTYALPINGIFKYNIHRPINEDYFVMPNEYKAIRFKYVHQLQNLYFALTGEELTIKK